MDHPNKFGRYLVKGVLGKGAMGVIYLAEDPVIGRQVAIKVIQLQPGYSEKEIENLQARFEREFRSAGTLSHPNIVTVHDVGSENNAPFIAMEYVPGKTLEHVINEQRLLTFEEISELVSQICDALDYAHASGVVHRDIKPANILLDRSMRPKITDFGVAKLADTGMTHTGAMVGTPWYMSPEQVVGETVSGASDQFALAVMTYQLLTRERPFSGERSSTVLYKIVHEEPTLPHVLNPRLGERIDAVLLRAFHKNPEGRYPSCTAFADEMSDALGVAPWRSAGKSQPGAPLPPTEWPTEALKIDPQTMQEWQAAARSGSGSGSGAGALPGPAADSRAGSGGGSRAGSAAGSRGGSRAASRAASAAGSRAASMAAVPPPAAPDAGPRGEGDPDATAYAAPPSGATTAAAAAAQPAPAKPQATPRRGGMKWAAIGAGVVALLAVVLVVLLRGGGGGSPAEPADLAALDADTGLPPGEELGEPILGDDPATTAALEAADIVDTSGVAVTGSGVSAEPQTYRIVTRPAGATVLLDGEPLEQPTPAEVELRGDTRYTLRIEMEGHAPVGWTFSAERLTADQQRNRTLYFPLTALASAGDDGATEEAPAERRQVAEAARARSVGPTSPPGRIDESAQTVRPGRDVPPPKRVQDAAPVFDPASLPAGRDAFVIVELTLDPSGQVAAAKVLRGLTPELDQIALRTAYQWRYEPSVLKGKPVNVVMSSTVRFDQQ